MHQMHSFRKSYTRHLTASMHIALYRLCSKGKASHKDLCLRAQIFDVKAFFILCSVSRQNTLNQ